MLQRNMVGMIVKVNSGIAGPMQNDPNLPGMKTATILDVNHHPGRSQISVARGGQLI